MYIRITWKDYPQSMRSRCVVRGSVGAIGRGRPPSWAMPHNSSYFCRHTLQVICISDTRWIRGPNEFNGTTLTLYFPKYLIHTMVPPDES